jgi:hypothetical protein
MFYQLMRTHTTLLLLLGMLNGVWAQSSFQTYPILDINFAMGFPVGDFGKTTNDAGFGADFGVYFPVSKRANWIKVGPQFMVLGTGSSTQRETQQIEISLGGQVIDVIELPLRIVTSNTLIGGHAVLRANAPINNPYLEPYLQGMIGFRRLATTVRIFDESDEGYFDPNEDGEISNSTPIEDWVFSYGGGGGVQIRLNKFIFLNLSALFLLGGEAEYYTKEDIKNFQFNFVGNNYTSGSPDLDPDDFKLDAIPSKSKTPIVQGNVGITILFSPEMKNK